MRAAAAAAYAAADFRAIKRFSLTISAREELYRSFSAAFTPTVAAGVWLSPQWKVRASTSRAFRIPSYTDLYYHDPGNVGNPNLRPESAWTYETGVDWVPSARIRGDLTLFERRERDGIDYYRTSATDIWRALNIQNLNFKGWEAALRWTPSLTTHRRFPFYATARHAGHNRRGLHQVHVQLSDQEWRFRLADHSARQFRIAHQGRRDRAPGAFALCAVGHLCWASAPQGAPLSAGEQRNEHVVPVDPWRGDAGTHDCRRGGSGDFESAESYRLAGRVPGLVELKGSSG